MEDLLPILIGIIWLGYTLYNKAQKKGKAKTQTPSAGNQPRMPSVLEQILLGDSIPQSQPYFSEAVDEVTQPIVTKIDKPKPVKKKPSPFLSEELSQFTQEGQYGIKPGESDAPVRELLQESLIKGYEFDLRKAVIYSEILNPPYIK